MDPGESCGMEKMEESDSLFSPSPSEDVDSPSATLEANKKNCAQQSEENILENAITASRIFFLHNVKGLTSDSDCENQEVVQQNDNAEQRNDAQNYSEIVAFPKFASSVGIQNVEFEFTARGKAVKDMEVFYDQMDAPVRELPLEPQNDEVDGVAGRRGMPIMGVGDMDYGSDFQGQTEQAPVADLPLEPVINEEVNEGNTSPASSKGSQDSVDFLDAQVECLSRAQQSTETANWGLLSKEEYKILEGYVGSPGYVGSMKHTCLNGLKAHLVDTGKITSDSTTSQELLKKLSSEKPEIMIARFGLITQKTYLKKKVFEESVSTEDPFTSDNPAMSEINEEVVRVSIPSTSSDSDTAPRPPIVPNCAGVTTANTDLNIPEVQPSDLSVEDSDLETAYDEIIRNMECKTDIQKAKKLAVMKAGQVLFRVVFTPEEQKECSLSGRNDAKPFDKPKMRLINQIIAWLLSQPQTRTMEEFRKAIKAGDLRLNSVDEDTLKQRVFTEFANQLRKKARTAGTAESTNSANAAKKRKRKN